MTVKPIILDKSPRSPQPLVRLSAASPSSVWQHVGFCLDAACGGDVGASRDLNRAAQAAASKLAEKVAGRSIEIELVIDPFIPLTNIAAKRLVPLFLALGENASASVEPGPGTVVISTWYRNGFAGIDAVGRGGHVPEEIRANILRPGFTTRVAEWDTGLGLAEASEAAAAIEGRVELFEPGDQEGVGFRFAMPICAGTPKGSPEARVCVDEIDEIRPRLHVVNQEALTFAFGAHFAGNPHADSAFTSIEA